MTLDAALHADPVAAAAGRADVAVFLLIGLLGGAHCLGMCGPLVNLYAGKLGDRRRTDGGAAARSNHLTLYDVRQHGLFNLGRAAGYATVGAAFALAGKWFFDAADAVFAVTTGVRAVSGIAVGSVIVLTGFYYVGGKSAALHRLTPGVVSGAFGAVAGRLTRHVDALVGDARIVVLGVFHGLLPCPITYPAYLYAFAIGDPLRAALLLGLLGLGTVPALFLYGTLSQSLSVSRRVRLHRVLGVAFVLLGYIPLSHGLLLLGVPVPHPNIPVYQPLG